MQDASYHIVMQPQRLIEHKHVPSELELGPSRHSAATDATSGLAYIAQAPYTATTWYSYQERLPMRGSDS